MSNILKFVFDNFSKLQPFDYILIILIVGMGLLVISIGARRIYGALIDAQTSLIKVKDKTITEYKSTTDRLRSEKSELLVSLDQTEARLHGLHEKFAALKNKHAELRGFLEGIEVGVTTLWKTTLISAMAIKRLEIIGCNRRMVHLYGHLREAVEGDSPEPIALLMRLDEVEQIVVDRLNALDEIVSSTPGKIVLPSSVPPRLAGLVQDDEINTTLEVFGGELDRLLDPVIAKYGAESAERRKP